MSQLNMSVMSTVENLSICQNIFGTEFQNATRKKLQWVFSLRWLIHLYIFSESPRRFSYRDVLIRIARLGMPCLDCTQHIEEEPLVIISMLPGNKKMRLQIILFRKCKWTTQQKKDHNLISVKCSVMMSRATIYNINYFMVFFIVHNSISVIKLSLLETYVLLQ